MPDTFGLQEYYVTETITEVAGADVRIICGVKRGGMTYWLYSVVMPADKLIIAINQCNEAAVEAINSGQMEFTAH